MTRSRRPFGGRAEDSQIKFSGKRFGPVFVFAFSSPILDVVPLCVVSFVDTESIVHSVEVEAHSLYEAGALGLAEFRSCGVVPHIGPAIVLKIEVRRPATCHHLPVSKVEAWLASGSKNPSEQAVKVRLKEALG